nr:GntR family transcriptional regulator [Paenibacillus thalictri]
MNDTTYSRVRDRLRSDILKGLFEPGTRLRIVDLSNRYGVSQMPIREALQQLQGEGLVTLLPQKGASVRKVDDRFVSNMYDVRAAIEAMLVRKAVEVLTGPVMDKIEHLQLEYERCASSGDMEEALAYNLQFHKAINELPQNPEAVEIINRHWGLIVSLRNTFGFSEKRIEDIIEDHRLLVNALKNRDGNAASVIADQHVQKAKADLLTNMKSKAEFKR